MFNVIMLLMLMTCCTSKVKSEANNSTMNSTGKNAEAFIKATREGKLDEAKALLATIPEKQMSHFVMAKDKDGRTALHLAASNGDVEMVKVLLKPLPTNQRADFIMTKNKKGQTALLAALGNLNLALMGFNIPPSEKKEDFIAKAPDRYLQVINILLTSVSQEQKSTLVLDKYMNSQTTLFYPVSQGNVKIVKTLVDAVSKKHRADFVMARNQAGMTALAAAFASTMMGKLPIPSLLALIKIFLSAIPEKQRFAFITTESYVGYKVLTLAALLGNLELVKMIIEAIPENQRANLIMDTTGEEGASALHAATGSGNVGIVKELIKSVPSKHRADFIMIKAENGTTALHSALRGRGLNFDIVKTLLKSLPTAKRAAFVTSVDEDGTTALHASAVSGKLEVVKFLLESIPEKQRAAFVITENQDGKTSLHLAVLNDHLDVIKLLIEFYQQHGIEIPQDLLPKLKELGGLN
ncbi:MAG: ankyrin repeat domain-containing protein [bacterium]